MSTPGMAEVNGCLAICSGFHPAIRERECSHSLGAFLI